MSNNYNQWIGDNWEILKNKSLKQMCLPGTHDSGTFKLELELAPDAEGIVPTLFNYVDTDNNASGAREYIRGQATSQSKAFRQQLDLGIRYIDLRVCQINGVYFCCHSLKGMKIGDLVSDIKNFLIANPTEIVVVKVGLKGIIDSDQAYKFLLSELEFSSGKSLGIKITSANELNVLLQTFKDNNTRCILIPDNESNFITSTYDSSITINSACVDNLKSKTSSFDASSGKLLESQCFRPTSNQNYALGYIQAEGAVALGPLAGLVGVGYNLTSEFKNIFNGESLPAVPKDLHENAQNSRTIIKDYFEWLVQSKNRPQLIICDFFDEVPIVDIGIALSTGQNMPSLCGIEDVPIPALRIDWFTSTVALVPSLVAGAAMVAGIGANDLGNYLNQNVPGITGEILGGAMKGAGYALGEVAYFILLWDLQQIR